MQSTSLYRRTIHHESCTFVGAYTVIFSLAIDALYLSIFLSITVNIVSLQKYQLLVQLNYYYRFFYLFFYFILFFMKHHSHNQWESSNKTERNVFTCELLLIFL